VTTTGACLVLAGTAAAVLVTAALTGLCRAPRLKRVLEEHDRAEAATGGCPDCGEHPCRVHDGIFWMALEQTEGLL